MQVRGAAVLAIVGSTAVGAQQRAGIAGSLVFDHVTVVDVAQGTLLPEQRVVIAGNRIQTVGAAGAVQLPNGARLVDARGKYLIPGLWDMHVHANATRWFDDIAVQDSLYREMYPRLIAHGVTGIREMAQRFRNGADSFRVWQHEVAAGTRVGPRAIGPSADVSNAYLIGIDDITLDTPEQAVHVVDSLKAAGDVFVKFHGAPDDRDIFFALLREARRVGLPVVGHIPLSVTEVEAVDSGMRSVEHAQGGGSRDCWHDSESADSATLENACAPVAKAYIHNGAWFTPTLIAMLLRSIQQETYPQGFTDVLRYVRTMHRLGVTKVLAGTDVAVATREMDPEFLPGLSAAEELVFLTAAGLTSVEALRAATLNPATFLGATDSLGTVAAGKLADLVLLDADPLADITNVLKVRAVVANGRYFDRSALDALDPEGTKPGRGMLAAHKDISVVPNP